MKHFLAVLFLVVLVCSLSACYYEVEEKYELLYDISEIEAIRIYQNESIQSGLKLDTQIAELSQEQYAQFINDLGSLTFSKGILLIIAPVDPSFETGIYVVEIVYKNGGFERISNEGYQEQKSSGGRTKGLHYSCDEEAWISFVQKYIPLPS